MNARTCQLCGKPLSRLRVGSDGDFCSREHRNQHRLRRGMDRLEEANKVTSLMRRRENPRHISAARLMCNSSTEPRGFYEPKQPAPKGDSASFIRMLPGPAAPSVRGSERFLPPQASRLAGTDAPRRADTSRIRIDGRGAVPLVPSRRQKLLVQIPRAPLVSLRCEAPAPAAAPRDFGMLRPAEIRTHLGGTLTPGARHRRRVPALHHRSRPRKIRSSALEGNALRVSIGIGFRAPALNRPDFFGRPAAPAALIWPCTPRRVLAEIHDSAAPCRNLEMAISTFRACLPEVSGGRPPAQFAYPGTVSPGRHRPAAGVPPATRATDIPWTPVEPVSRGMAARPPAAGFAKRNGAHLFAIAMMPSSTHPARQVAATAFVPQDPVGCPRVAFEGTVAAAIASSPGVAGTTAEIVEARAVEPVAAVRIEEHFGSGWDNWVGGMKDWLVDVAGVRTGPLALFVPTMDLIDYDLDFLARIDTRSLTWVVRAAGLEDYMRCTLTAVAGGELEFTRCAVVAGAAQEPVTAARRLPGKPRSAMTVSTCVSGQRFTVSVDGKDIDTWNDDGFPMGGIGFIGAPDDRARLYWVRLSSTETTAKEHEIR